MIDPISGTALVTALLCSAPQTRTPRWTIQPDVYEEVIRETEHTMFIGSYSEVSKHALIYQPATKIEQDYRAKLLSKLHAWKQLPDGWDGEQSLSPEITQIDLAATLINLLPADVLLPKPMLSSSGEVGLYWDTHEKYVDLEFNSNHVLSAYLRDKQSGRETFVDNLSLNDADLDSIFAMLGSTYRNAA